MKIGAQLFTLHDYTKTLDEFEEVLKKVSEIGFKYVQVSGTCDFEADWLKEKLDKYGLKCVLTHTKPAAILEQTEQVCKNHDVFDCKYIGLGGMPRLWSHNDFTNDEVVDKFIEEYSPAMEIMANNGKYFMYHNHHFEFARLESGEFMWDALINRIPADKMGFTLDTYWLQYGGVNPAKEIRKLKGRLPCVHFKDYKVLRCSDADKNVRFAPVGEGNLDWDEIIEACEYAGTDYVLIEQDNCFGEDPYDCLKRSFEFLKSKGLKVE